VSLLHLLLHPPTHSFAKWRQGLKEREIGRQSEGQKDRQTDKSDGQRDKTDGMNWETSMQG